jgi:hypothetical protein
MPLQYFSLGVKSWKTEMAMDSEVSVVESLMILATVSWIGLGICLVAVGEVELVTMVPGRHRGEYF